jgi:TP901 family phage tail tape measure protein
VYGTKKQNDTRTRAVANEYAKLIISLEANTAKFVGPMNSAGGVIGGVTDKLKSFGAAMIAGFAAHKVIDFAKSSVDSFKQFDLALVKSTSIMEGLTRDMQRDLGKTARAMSLETKTSAAELAGSFYHLASAGMSAQQSIKALPIVEKFAIAGAMDTARATELLATSLSSMNMKAKDPIQNMKNMEAIANALAKANNIALGSVENFALALKTKFGPEMSKAGRPLAETVAILGAFANAGLMAEVGGTQAYMMLRDLQTASLKNKEAWEGLGIAVYDTEGKLRRVPDILKDLNNKLSGMSDMQRKSALLMLGFKDKSMAATNAVIKMTEAMDEMQMQIESGGDVIGTVAGKQMEALSNKSDMTKNHFIALKDAAGQTLAPAISALKIPFVALSDTLTDILTQFNDMREGMKDIFEDKLGTRSPIGDLIKDMIAPGNMYGQGKRGTGDPATVAIEEKTDKVKELLAATKEQIDLDVEYSEEVLNLANTLNNESMSAQDKFLKGQKQINDALETGLINADAASYGIEKLTEEFIKADPAMVKLAEDIKRTAEEKQKLEEEAASLTASTMSPLDMMTQEVNRAGELRDKGLITEDTYKRAVQAATDEYLAQNEELQRAIGYTEMYKDSIQELRDQILDMQMLTSKGLLSPESLALGTAELEKQISSIEKEKTADAMKPWLDALKQYSSQQQPIQAIGDTLAMGMQYMNQMVNSLFTMGQLVPSSGVQIMDIGASRFSAPGQAASMSASEAASMMGGGLEDVSRQQLTTQKNIETGINQVAFLLARGLI